MPGRSAALRVKAATLTLRLIQSESAIQPAICRKRKAHDGNAGSKARQTKHEAVRKCQYTGCGEINPRYGVQGSSRGTHCSKHANKARHGGSMIDLSHDYDLGCTFIYASGPNKRYAPEGRNSRCKEESSRRCPCSETICKECARDKSFLARRACTACSIDIGPCHCCAADTKECGNCDEPVCDDCSYHCACGETFCEGDCRLYHRDDCEEMSEREGDLESEGDYDDCGGDEYW